MCRYDDDFDWYVESENAEAVSDVDLTCQDCSRVIPAGEQHTAFTATEVDDLREYVFIAHWPIPHGPDRRTWFFQGDPFVIIDEDDIEVWEALGFSIDEVPRDELYPKEPEYHISCNHCRAANIWLVEVCDQHVVMVTSIDIPEHRYEYTDEQLGTDFVTMETLCRQQWRSKLTGQLIPVSVIERLALNAAEHANAGGLVA